MRAVLSVLAVLVVALVAALVVFTVVRRKRTDERPTPAAVASPEEEKPMDPDASHWMLLEQAAPSSERDFQRQ